MGADWRFLKGECEDPRLSWEIHSGAPRNWPERRIRKPALSRYRAVISATSSLRRSPDGVLVSHLPNMPLSANALRLRLAADKPHIAFAFNFTTMPTGWRHEAFKRSLPSVDEMVVFSRHEIDLYADYFNLPAEKFRFLPWAMHAPEYDPSVAPPFDAPYLCALGGEGRDYQSLVEAMRRLPDLRLALIARPYSIAGLDMPENVRVYTNIPSRMAWGIVKKATGLVIPLVTDQTANGHVTIVGAQLLGIPLAVTTSLGVVDYVNDETAFMMQAGNLESIHEALLDLGAEPDIAAAKATAALATAQANSRIGNWVDYFISLEDRLSA